MGNPYSKGLVYRGDPLITKKASSDQTNNDRDSERDVYVVGSFVLVAILIIVIIAKKE